MNLTRSLLVAAIALTAFVGLPGCALIGVDSRENFQVTVVDGNTAIMVDRETGSVWVVTPRSGPGRHEGVQYLGKAKK